MPTIYLKRTSPLMTKLGANIARELKKLGITQGELSERSGHVRQCGVISVLAIGLHFQAALGVICSG